MTPKRKGYYTDEQLADFAEIGRLGGAIGGRRSRNARCHVCNGILRKADGGCTKCENKEIVRKAREGRKGGEQ